MVNKVIRAYPKQLQFLESNKQLRAFVGGIGSGKSFIGALDMIRRAKAGRLYLVTAPTYPMLADASFRSFVSMAHELGVVAAGDIKASPPPEVRLRTGAEVLFRSTDNPEMLRGPNLSGVWMDEASLSKREAFNILVGRLREGGEQGWMTATFTPKGKAHWTYRTFGKGAPGVELVHARTGENPFLPSEFEGNVRKHYTKAQAAQELGGSFTDAGGTHYYPDDWPRYRDVGDAYRVVESAFEDAEGNRRYTMRHVRKADCSRLLALDWAMGKPKKGQSGNVVVGPDGVPELTGDCTGFVVADLDNSSPEGWLFLLDAVNERVPLAQNAPRLAELCRKWLPVVVAGDDDNLTETMTLECRRFADIPTIKPMGIRSRNKLTRSQSAIVRADRRQILLPEETPSGHGQEWVEVLTDQVAAFTGEDGMADDIADCVSILGRLADEFRPHEAQEDWEPDVVGGYGGIDGGW